MTHSKNMLPERFWIFLESFICKENVEQLLRKFNKCNIQCNIGLLYQALRPLEAIEPIAILKNRWK